MANPANVDIRAAVKAAGLFLWQVAERYGITDSNFSRKLRKELPPQERERVMGIIEQLANEKQEVT